MKKIIFLTVILIIFLTGCKKFIQPGINPVGLEKDIPYNKGTAYFKDERLEVKYLIVQNYIKKDSDDIIFYLHGFNRTEFEWIEKNGFGKMFYSVIKENPDFNSFTVVSISLGGAFILINQAPAPFSADLESFFINKIIPYFKEKLNKTGNVYLIGHSLGGFNSLMISLRNPDKFPAIAVISPYVAPISPFTQAFDDKGKELKMPVFQTKMLKALLTNAFGSEAKWEEYNPFKLLENQKKPPFISISDAHNDLPGFEWSIDNYSKELEKKGIDHAYCKSNGDHWTTCLKFFYSFLDRISKK